MYYDKHFFDWYENVYLKAKDAHAIKLRKELSARRKKISALEKKLTEKQNKLDELKELNKSFDMQVLANKLNAHKKRSKLTFREIAETVGVPLYAIANHSAASIKNRSKNTKAIEHYLDSIL